MREGDPQKNLSREACDGWAGQDLERQVTKVQLIKTLVFPVGLYGAETWTVKKSDRTRIDAFELWCWRRVLRVSWMERKTNIWVVSKVRSEWTLESTNC